MNCPQHIPPKFDAADVAAALAASQERLDAAESEVARLLAELTHHRSQPSLPGAHL